MDMEKTPDVDLANGYGKSSGIWVYRYIGIWAYMHIGI